MSNLLSQIKAQLDYDYAWKGQMQLVQLETEDGKVEALSIQVHHDGKDLGSLCVCTENGRNGRELVTLAKTDWHEDMEYEWMSRGMNPKHVPFYVQLFLDLDGHGPLYWVNELLHRTKFYSGQAVRDTHKCEDVDFGKNEDGESIACTVTLPLGDENVKCLLEVYMEDGKTCFCLDDLDGNGLNRHSVTVPPWKVPQRLRRFLKSRFTRAALENSLKQAEKEPEATPAGQQ